MLQRHGGFGELRAVGKYEPRRGVSRATDPYADADFRLKWAVTAHLFRHYPGHHWVVLADHRQGIVTVGIPRVSHKWTHNIHISALANDPGWKLVVDAGGDVLERVNLPRRGFDLGLWDDLKRKIGNPAVRFRNAPPGGR